MLWHRQAIFESKGDKLSSSAESRIRTHQDLRHQIASRLNARWQTDWAIEDQAKKLELDSPSLWSASIQPTRSHSRFGIRTWLWRYTCLLLLISMLWHRQAIFESKGDKLSSSAESRIRTHQDLRHQIASRLNARWQTDWAIEDQAKKLELDSPSLWSASIQPTRSHSRFGIRTWLWRYTCLLLLISMLWHRQAIFESKGDKLSSSAESRIRTHQDLRHQIASRLNARWQTDWAIEDQAKKLELDSPSLWSASIQPTRSHSRFGIRTWLWRYTCLLLLISMLWHRQAIFESKGDKLSSSAESRIRTHQDLRHQIASRLNARWQTDWAIEDQAKKLELDSPSLWSASIQPTRSHSRFGIRTWLWRYTCLLLLISMLWHRQAIFESKGDKLSSSAESRIRTHQDLRHQIASRLNARWQTDWAIEDQAKKLELDSPSLWSASIQPTRSHSRFGIRTWLWRYTCLLLLISMLWHRQAIFESKGDKLSSSAESRIRTHQDLRHQIASRLNARWQTDWAIEDQAKKLELDSPSLWSASIQPTRSHSRFGIRTWLWRYTCLLLLISMLWHRQAISESKGDKLSSSAESRIRTHQDLRHQIASRLNARWQTDWAIEDQAKKLELDSPSLWSASIQPTRSHSRFGIRTWLWRYTCLLLLISMLWHRQAIFESKGDKLSSSAESRIRTHQDLRHQIASRLNARWQTDWAIEDQAKKLELDSPSLWSASIQPTRSHSRFGIRTWLWRYTCLLLLISMLWHRQAIFESKGDKLSSSAESRIRTHQDLRHQIASRLNARWQTDWAIEDQAKKLELDSPSLWSASIQPTRSHSRFGICTWLWRYTCLLLLISMLWHRQAIFESKGDKLSSSAESRIRTHQDLRHQIASRLNARWQTDWAIEDQAKKLELDSPSLWSASIQPTRSHSRFGIRTWLWRYTCLLLLISMLWHRQAIFESKGDKLSSSAESRIRTHQDLRHQIASRLNARWQTDWAIEDQAKKLELDSPSLWSASIQPTRSHSRFGIRTWLWRYTCLLLLISMLWHRQAIFESKGDKLSSSAESRIRTHQDLRHQIASRLNARWQTDWAIEDQAKKLELDSPSLWSASIQPTRSHSRFGIRTWLWRYTCLLLLISMLWHRQAIFESKGDKLSSSAESRIRTHQDLRHQIASRLNARWQTDWAIEDQAKKLELDSPSLWSASIQPTRSHSRFGIRTWLWRYTCLLLLISMLWHRQAIFESKGDKLSSSAESRIRTHQDLRHQIASRLNARWQTDWAIEDQAKKLELDSPSLWIKTH